MKTLKLLLAAALFACCGAECLFAQTATQVTTSNGLSDGDFIYLSDTNGKIFTGTGISDGGKIESLDGNPTALYKVIFTNTTVTVNSVSYDQFKLQRMSDGTYIPTATGQSNSSYTGLAMATDTSAAATFSLEDGSVAGTTAKGAVRLRTFQSNDNSKSTFLRIGSNDYHNGTAEGTLIYVYKFSKETARTFTYDYQLDGTSIKTQSYTLVDGFNFPSTVSIDFCTASGEPTDTVKASDEGKTYTITFETENYPVKYSSSLEKATWYFLTIGGYQMHDNGEEDSMSLTRQTVSMADKGDLWCFVGDPYNGFKVYNGNANKLLAFKSTNVWTGSNGVNNYAVLVESSDENLSSYLSTWSLTPKKDGTVPSTGNFYLYPTKESTGSRPCLTYDSNKLVFHNNNYKNSNLDTSEALLASTTIPAPTMHLATSDSQYYSTLYLPYEAKVEGAEVFYGASVTSESDDTQKMQMTELTDGIIPANQGVLLVSTDENATLTLSSTSASLPDGVTNLLKGTCTDSTIASKEEYLVFGQSGESIGFFMPNVTTLSANRAYVNTSDVTTSTQGNATQLFLDFGSTTGIAHIAVPSENAGAPIFDLSGRRVAKAVRGIYIQGGKKILVR